MEKTTGKKPNELKSAKQCPEELVYIWEWYCEVFTGSRLTFSEIKAWAEITCKDIRAWEVEALARIDRINAEA